MAGVAEFLIFDASSSLYRAFHALPEFFTATGVPTNAALGFTRMLRKLLRERAPTYAAVAWDSPKPRRRDELFPQYKAKRDVTDENLRAQFPYARRIVEAHRLASFEYAGEEADDVIATLAKRAAEAGLDVVIVSTDKDLMQLVGDHIRLLDAQRDRLYGPAEVEARFGVPPTQMLDFRALTGDASDNIPGVRGIGDKGAAQLLTQFGSLDKLIERVDEIQQSRSRKALSQGIESARLSKQLSRLRDDLPLSFELEELRVAAPDTSVLLSLCEELEFRQLLSELGGEMSPEAPSGADRIEVAVDRPAVVDLSELVRELRSAERIGVAMVLAPPLLESPGAAERLELVGLALCSRPQRAAYLDLHELGREQALEALAPLLASPDVSWVGHSLKAFHVALQRLGIPLAGRLADVSVAAYLVDPSDQVDRMEALSAKYLGRSVPADEDVFGKGAKRVVVQSLSSETLASFCAGRAALALELESAIERELGTQAQRALLEELEQPLTRVLAHMEEAGVRVDREALDLLSVELSAQLEKLEVEIHALAGESFNIASTKQLQRILFEKLKLPPSKRTKTGFSTDESVLEELALRFDLPQRILEFRRLSKLKSTYVDALPKLIDPRTGRIHCQFNQTVAATGRLSSSNPNLQNIPIRTPQGQRIREAFIPREGYLLLAADYSQIELRILAHLSEDPALVEAFQRGEDIHQDTAARVFGISLADVTAEQRAAMKAVNFGILYGSSAFGLARQLGVSQSVAAGHIDAYFSRYPQVRSFLDATIERARELGYAETLAGRRRYLPDLHAKNRARRAAAERMATNSVIQGTAADLIKQAMVRLDVELRRDLGDAVALILQVHDELVFEVTPEQLEVVARQVADRMQNVAELRVPLIVHLGHGGSWREAH